MTSIQEQIETIAKQLPKTLLAQRISARRELNSIRRAVKQKVPSGKLQARCTRLAERMQASVAIRQARLRHRPRLDLNPDLPIAVKAEELVTAIKSHRVLIVAGETGSGKTTQLPKLCMAAGRGIEGYIGVTQPRRIAAMTVGRRIAEELGEDLGQTVGFKVRFQDAVSDSTRIKLMTDGILLAETHKDPFLNQYDTIIVDEAHERSLNIDFTIGILKKLLNRRRDLKVIITSATIDTEKFSQAFDRAPVIEVSGRMYPVETRYQDYQGDNGQEATHIEMAVRAVDQLPHGRKRGDILIFMPTEQDIRDTCELIQGRSMPATQVIPLFARLSAAEQQKVFRPAKGRKIIVATNVAETSITIPGIQYVIDTGLARVSQYTPRSRTTTLPVVPIARSSADQRMGRCGRVANGICIRLYSQENFDNRPQYTTPEILRANLAEVILRMIALKLGDVEDFPFIDPPKPRSIQDGYKLLSELGAIRPSKSRHAQSGKYALTAKGRLMSMLPLDPRLSCMLLEAHTQGCLADLAIIAAALSIQDPRERPVERQAEADIAQARFVDPTSDFITLLRIWHGYQDTVTHRASWNQVKKYCRTHFLSYRRMREWQDIHRQLLRVMAEHDIRAKGKAIPPTEVGEIENSWYAAVHQCILSGFLSNIAMKKEKQIFMASYNRQVMIFPGSGLFKNPGQWIVAAEMVETSRLFARCAAIIDPGWLETIGKSQCKYTYLDPHWERKRGQVVATEQVSLYGLVIDRRMRPFGPVDPAIASDIFIRHALIHGDVRQVLPFMKHNRQLLTSIEDMEDRLRRKDLLVDEETMLQFYEQRLGQIYDMRTLINRIRKNGDDSFVRMGKDDLLRCRPDEEALTQFPDQIPAGPHQIACEYRFAPGKPNDGVTVRVPAKTAGNVGTATFQWLVPGLFKEKITALIKGLPKEFRKQLVPVADTVEIILAEMTIERQASLINTLSGFVRNRFRANIPATAWDETLLPDHLRMRIALIDDNGRVINSGRDAAILRSSSEDLSQPDDFKRACQAWERNNIDQWNFGDLPGTVTLTGSSGRQWTAYPALQARGDSLVLTVFADVYQAQKAHPQGVKALLMRHFRQDLKFLEKNLQLPLSYDAASRYFDGRKVLTERLVAKVLDDLMAKNVRTAEGFHAKVQQLEISGIAASGQTKWQKVLDVLAAYADLRSRFYSLEKTKTSNSPALAFLEELRGILNQLVPKNFVQLYDNARLQRLIRYIQALGLRVERGLIDLKKDRSKADCVAPYIDRLAHIINELDPQSSDEKRKSIETLFWMLEEYKISIFAPEIKTAHPISVKRLKGQVEEIESLV